MLAPFDFFCLSEEKTHPYPFFSANFLSDDTSCGQTDKQFIILVQYLFFCEASNIKNIKKSSLFVLVLLLQCFSSLILVQEVNQSLVHEIVVVMLTLFEMNSMVQFVRIRLSADHRLPLFQGGSIVDLGHVPQDADFTPLPPARMVGKVVSGPSFDVGRRLRLRLRLRRDEARLREETLSSNLLIVVWADLDVIVEIAKVAVELGADFSTHAQLMMLLVVKFEKPVGAPLTCSVLARVKVRGIL